MGLFILLFFLSSITLALLVLDDQKDMSSRASISLVGGLQPALPTEKLVPNESVWDGRLHDLPVIIRYNPALWFPPDKDAPVFYHLGQSTTARIIVGSVTLGELRQILGSDFVAPQFLGTPRTNLENWNIQSYSFHFLGEEKIVDVWIGSGGISLVAVMSDDSTRREVGDLASQTTYVEIGKVQGDSTPDDSARLAAQMRPSVVMILNNFCAQANFSGKAYPFCLAQAGSGFFVNKDGYIATNGHVVGNLPETSIFNAVTTGGLDGLLVDSLQAYYSVQMGSLVDKTLVETKVKEAHAKKEAIYQIAGLIGQMYKKNLITLESAESHYFIQLGNTPIQLSKTGINSGSGIVTATLIASDYAEPDSVLGFSTSDVALLKINGTNFPALSLGNLTDVGVGSGLLLVGFPGVAMGSNSQLLDTSANAEPTFTKGVVSAFKQAKGNKKNLIQTDASINHGNSGGPAVSTDGKVVGLATYGLTPDEGGGNYNFLRDIGDLKELMVKNNVTADMGETYAIWKSGLNNYWISYFKSAKADFERVLSLYPDHPTASRYLNEATSKTGSLEDKTPRFTRAQRQLYIGASSGLMIFSVMIIVVLGVSNYIDSKRRRAPVILPPRAPLPPRPIQTF